jgi:hypothetical protein
MVDLRHLGTLDAAVVKCSQSQSITMPWHACLKTTYHPRWGTTIPGARVSFSSSPADLPQHLQPYCGEEALDAPHSSDLRLMVGTDICTDMHVTLDLVTIFLGGGDKGGRK